MSDNTTYDKASYDAGYTDALEQMAQRRMYFRAMVELPVETHMESLKRIFDNTDKDREYPTIVNKTVAIVGDAVDLYLMVAPQDQLKKLMGELKSIVCASS